jgi:hypothetical protein
MRRVMCCRAAEVRSAMWMSETWMTRPGSSGCLRPCVTELIPCRTGILLDAADLLTTLPARDRGPSIWCSDVNRT